LVKTEEKEFYHTHLFQAVKAEKYLGSFDDTEDILKIVSNVSYYVYKTVPSDEIYLTTYFRKIN